MFLTGRRVDTNGRLTKVCSLHPMAMSWRWSAALKPWFAPLPTRFTSFGARRLGQMQLSTGIGGVRDGAPPAVFNRDVKRIQRTAAALNPNRIEFAQLREEIADRLVDRIQDTTRKFRVAADLGCADGQVLKRLVGGIGGITTLYQCDSSQAMLDLCSEGEVNGVMAHKMLVDEENLPFEKESMDLIISNLNLHWTNDAPSALVQIRDSLRPDGLFMGSMFGGDTLIELRHAFTLAEMERDGGVSPHVSPLAGIEDAGNLLGRSGFSIPAVDTDKFTVQFPSAMDMMHTLQGMGENNAIAMRRPYVSRDTMLAAAAAYEAIYGDENGVVPATFQVIYLSGWAPHESQQQAKKKGSATVSLSEIGEVTVLGDAPTPGSTRPPTPGMDTSRGG